ncbi:MAG: tyrosine-type recombinase/integrase, partial [Nanoarchaeota archaeon]|nr:tyrosine-type recombinase/integrase [Nanoarchaeota archaeon]
FIKKDVDSIKPDDVKKFLANLLSVNNYDASSVALARSSLKYFYDDLLKKNILIDIKTPKKQRKIPDVPTKEEIKVLIENSGSLRNKLLIELMYSSGLRVSECSKIRLNDLNLDEKTGLLKSGKGGKDRFFILSEKLVEDIRKYMEIKGEVDYLFPGVNGSVGIRAIQRVITRVAKKSGIKKHIYCHLLRHAFATHLLEDGVDIRKIQILMAHSNLQTTSFYTQVSTKELKKVKSPLDTI